jgi:hypothetical protein
VKGKRRKEKRFYLEKRLVHAGFTRIQQQESARDCYVIAKSHEDGQHQLAFGRSECAIDKDSLAFFEDAQPEIADEDHLYIRMMNAQSRERGVLFRYIVEYVSC